MNHNNRKEIVNLCEKKLLNLRERYEHTLAMNSSFPEEKAEVIDLATREIQMQDSSLHRRRMANLLPEIISALGRIQNGTFGICEITGEFIEERRLLAVPWTRISIKSQTPEAS
ncbi:MAG: TraR/DksA family transcriptional regulator [Halobacteriovoraceae bacterium]|nr:TraR/DksA family transcriptional regulator [Halobacteriovoraceae bacterium]